MRIAGRRLPNRSCDASAHDGTRDQVTCTSMDNTIVNTSLGDNQYKLWEIQRDCLNKIYATSGTEKRKQRAKIHPVLMSRAVTFLARTAIIMYKEVQKVMKLPDLLHI